MPTQNVWPNTTSAPTKTPAPLPEGLSVAQAPKPGDVATYNAELFTPGEDAIVENRLNNLISQDSQYMQQARAGALQTANQRGLLNSSMAAGAGEAAAIASALPIASQDASMFANTGLANVDAKNKASGFNAGELNNQSRLGQELTSREKVSAQQLAGQQAIASAQIASANINAQAAREIAALTAAGSAIGGAMADHNAFVRAVSLSPDLTEDQKAIQIANDEAATADAIYLSGSIFGVDGLDQILGTFGTLPGVAT